jgi:hypothetical protein
MNTTYMSKKQTLYKLNTADLIVYPYQKTDELLSAEVHNSIVSLRLVAFTPLSIFDDIESLVYKLPGTTSMQMADGIEVFWKSKNRPNAESKYPNSLVLDWISAHQHKSIASRLMDMVSEIEN